MPGLSVLPAYPGHHVVCAHLRAPSGDVIHGTPVASPEGQSGGILTAGCAADPRGPWLRAELCCLGPSRRTTTPSASLAGTRGLHGVTAYTPGLRCAGAPRRPARPSRLSLACCPHVPSTLPRWVRWSLPLSSASDPRLPRMPSESPPTAPSLPAILDGGPFRGCIVRVRLRPVRLPGPPGWLRRDTGPAC
jgi:hypothetical protein